MTTNLENTPPPNLKQISRLFRLVGWFSFVGQIILLIVSTLMLFVAAASGLARSPSAGTADTSNSIATGGSSLFSILSLLALLYAAYRAFGYVRLGRQLRANVPAARPSKVNTITNLWMGIMVSGSGMLLAILAAEAIAGSLFIKSLAQLGGLFVGNMNLVQPLDIFLVLANTHLVTAHFLGLISSVFLLNRIDR
ncbi:MAG: DUF3611 family protein [Synechococcales bacterium]|nr:DUF3611 family protein [Synechococcales bacterium]